jgi:Tfp pilus assembly protein PilF
MRLIRSAAVALALSASSVIAADYPSNQQPMYGGVEKTPQMRAADDAFLRGVARLGYSRERGSDKSVDLGWQYFARRDFAAAMMRFNQAWLQDRENGDAFHGFAVVTAERDGDLAQADALFRHGVASKRQKPGIYLDYGRFLLKDNRPADAVAVLEKAVQFADMRADAQALLALALFQAGRRDDACNAAAQVKDGVQPALLQSLRLLPCARAG